VNNIKIDLRDHGPRLGSVADFGINGVKPSGSAIRHLLQDDQAGRQPLI
jgi:hypothetical protein